MNVGIPGTGLGGLFYALSVIVMISIELFYLLIGKSNKEKRQLALRQSAMLLGIILSLVSMDLFLEKVLISPMSPFANAISVRAADGADALAISTTLIGLAVLAVIGILVQVLRVFFAPPKFSLIGHEISDMSGFDDKR